MSDDDLKFQLSRAEFLQKMYLDLAASESERANKAVACLDMMRELQEKIDNAQRSWVQGRDAGMRARSDAETFADEPDELPETPANEHPVQWSSGWRRGWQEMAAHVERDALREENDSLKARLNTCLTETSKST